MIRLPRRASTLVAAAALAVAGLAAPALAGPTASPAAADSSNCPWVSSTASPQARADQVLAQMTTAEKLSMVHGSPVGGYAGVQASIPRLCIPQLNLLDGGAGVVAGGATVMPAPIAAAATFDPATEQAYGTVVGAEDLTKGVSVNLGPNVNMERDPRGGRVFEGAGEDPYLTGAMATGYVDGVQSQGVMADVKHLVANDAEQNRNNANAVVDQRTLNEIYYPPFKETIQQGHAASVMAATSLLNGTHDNENYALLTTELKQDWGFGGWVVSDWDSARSTLGSANGGLDLNMPQAGNFGDALTAAVADGQVSLNLINDKVERILTTEFQFGLFNRVAGSPGATATTPAHVQTAQDIAAAGTVLMRNQKSILPLDAGATPTVAVIGPAGGSEPITGGGGSSHVPAGPPVTVADGIAQRLGSNGRVDYITGGWNVTAFSTADAGDAASNMVDGDAATRWTSGTPQAPGQAITVDTGAAHDMDQITLDSGTSAGDYARGYQVYLSADGTDWGDPVATGTGTGSVESIDFTRQSARYVKVVQTGTASSWWSIAEFTVSAANPSGVETALQRTTPLSVPGTTDTLPTVPSTPFSTAEGKPGLTASYYNNLTVTGQPALTRVEPNIDDHYTAAPGPGVNAAGFSTRWTGFLTVPTTGTYTFSMKNTGGVRMWIDNQPVFSDWAQYGPGTSAIHLAGGTRLPITVENYQPINGPSGPVAGTPASTPTNGSITLGWQQPNTAAIAAAAAEAKSASVAVIVVNDDESEDGDRQNLTLPGAQDDLITAVAKANPHTVVVLNTGAPVLMPWLASVPAVLESWYGGQQNGAALASVLFGDVNPSAKLPQTWPASMSQLPTIDPSRYPGDVDVSSNSTELNYTEGLDIGYRWYDAKNLTPLFPFGFGLSYSSFAYSNIKVKPNAAATPGDVTVSATVRNTGARSAADVAQLYVGFPARAGEPPRQLKGFQKLTLAAGASQRVTFTLTPSDLQIWDTKAAAWSSVPGTFQLYVGDSSRDLPLRSSYVVATTTGARTVKLAAAKSFTPGQPNIVQQTLTASGNQTLAQTKLGLTLPVGWTARPVTRTSFGTVSPGTTLHATWAVTPPVSDQVLIRRLAGTATARGGYRTSSALQVAISPAVSAELTSPASIVHPGDTVKARLSLHNATAKTVTVSPTVTGATGLSISPTMGVLTVRPGETVPEPLTVTASSSAAAFQLSLTGSFTLAGKTYPLAGATLRLPLVVPLSAAYDNVGVSDDAAPAAGNFDGSGYSYSAGALAQQGITPGTTVAGGLRWPEVAAGQPDNVVAHGQSVTPVGSGNTLSILGAASNGDGHGTMTIHYTDGSTSTASLGLTNWTNTVPAEGDQLITTADGWNRPAGSSYPATEPVSLYAATVKLATGRVVAYVELPTDTTGSQVGTQLHLFDLRLS